MKCLPFCFYYYNLYFLDGEEKVKKKIKVEKVVPKPNVVAAPASSASSSTVTSVAAPTSSANTTATTSNTTVTPSPTQSVGSGGIRRLRDFETSKYCEFFYYISQNLKFPCFASRLPPP